ncbi:ATP-grasp fold amidoligase family protein [Zobellia russellii]|uniref:ATP-grasp fold amidoligase family protein n=1 Tax=Zobellia russellii TaxID=248907 RepID=UPI001BFF1828|nr:ATP-grasp fold amidoligase family protein [Zobellia russellii]MBT9189029.1 glycosyl transferase [Zobellia russellii]
MYNFLKQLYYNTKLGNIIIGFGIDLYIKTVPDKPYIQRAFKKSFGRKINFNNPKSLNEKINWLKLYDRTPLHTQCADKYAVRDYVKSKIGEEFLVPLYLQTEDVTQINENTINKRPCIIKTNHDSGGGIFVTEETNINWAGVRDSLKDRMSKNYFRTSREWQYKKIKPCIIVEQLLMDKNGNIPMDYKLHCFNGNVRMIQVDMGRGTDHHHRNWYDVNWNREPYKWSSPKGNGKYTDPSIEDAEKPKTLEKMILLSQKLSEPFAYVRVDWYDIDGVLFFGELTFHHDGGLQPILPKEWDYTLGKELNIDKIN